MPLAAHVVVPTNVVLKHGDLEKLSDFAARGEFAEKVWAGFERETIEALGPEVARLLPGGALEITFADIDRAGDVNTMQNRGDTKVRYFKEIYPPRTSFDYVLKDGKGTTVLAGKARLQDLDFQMNLSPRRNSMEFFYEVEMLRNWIHRDLAKALAAKTP